MGTTVQIGRGAALGVAIALVIAACESESKRTRDDDDAGAAGATGGAGMTPPGGGGQGGRGEGGAGSTAAGGSAGSGAHEGGSPPGGCSVTAEMVERGFGSDTACSSCATVKCCPQLEAFHAAGTQATFDALVACVDDFTGCPDCLYPICDATNGDGAPVGHFFAGACATCKGVNCCPQTKSCLHFPGCHDCLFYGEAVSCDASTLDEAMFGCWEAMCSEVCP